MRWRLRVEPQGNWALGDWWRSITSGENEEQQLEKKVDVINEGLNDGDNWWIWLMSVFGKIKTAALFSS